MAARTLAIGDVHGCAAALEALLAALELRADDTLFTLGDYIDRGPDSRGVIELLMQVSDRTQLVPLLGNHELMLLAALENPSAMASWLEFGGLATLDSYGGDLRRVPSEHLDFLDRCHRYYETERYLFLHANYDPQLPAAEQPEFLAFWQHLRTPPSPHMSGKTVVVGHTPQLDGEVGDHGHVLCLDTFCVGGGWLTALDLDTRQAWQADKYGRLRAATPRPLGDASG